MEAEKKQNYRKDSGNGSIPTGFPALENARELIGIFQRQEANNNKEEVCIITLSLESLKPQWIERMNISIELEVKKLLMNFEEWMGQVNAKMK